MKTFTLLAVLAFSAAAGLASAFEAGPPSVAPVSLGKAVERDLALPVRVAQSAPVTPPSIFTFAPGSSWGIDTVALPPSPGSNGWDFSECVSTTVFTMLLGRGFWAETDVLLGMRLRNSSLTAGYAVDVAGSLPVRFGPNTLQLVGKLGVAQLFGSAKAVPGLNGSVSVQVVARS